MLKGRILGIFCWICLFSECFLSIRDVVWQWALLVGRLWALLVGWLWALLVLESFLRDLVCWRVNIDCSKRESSLLG